MIQIENLTKRYGGLTAVDNISFDVRPGSVVGFLGPNGAGKSTALRMTTGLTRPTSGRATILGQPFAHLTNPARHVGVMLDAAAQHPGRTGREVLRLAAIAQGVSSKRVDEVLDVVGLTERESARRVRHYSLGMRQRLGLAGALIGEPEVLILDEPANGLDPQGIHWMRGLLRSHADIGGTVLLSSHLLHEIQVIADELVIIGKGRIMAQGTKDELLQNSGSRARSTDDAALEVALRAGGHAVTRTANGLTVDAAAEVVGRAALHAGVVLIELGDGGTDGLEDLFLTLTAEASREGVAA